MGSCWPVRQPWPRLPLAQLFPRFVRLEANGCLVKQDHIRDGSGEIIRNYIWNPAVRQPYKFIMLEILDSVFEGVRGFLGVTSPWKITISDKLCKENRDEKRNLMTSGILCWKDSSSLSQ